VTLKKMMTSKLLLAFGLVAVANAMCPNSCSGNGKCGQFDKCACHQNWQGPDCSLRTCPYELAWVDVGTNANDAHYYAECANKGTCDRKSGECKCFDGYEGKGCRRSTCPEACSGHGTCQYIDELIEDVEHKRSKNYNGGKRIASDYTTAGGVGSTNENSLVTGKTYELWDQQKIQGCQCDANWEGPDCSAKTCPRGDDPLTTQINANFFSTYVNRQLLQLGVAAANGGDTTNQVTVGEEFDITYYDLYGGKWVTQEIVVATDKVDTAANMQTALRNLPNKVMEGVQVYPSSEANTKFGTTPAKITKDRITYVSWTACDDTQQQCFIIEFADKPGSSGLQYLLEVDGSDKDGNDGYQPTSAGFTLAAAVASVYEMIEDDGTATASTGLDDAYNLGNTGEAAVCSNRGLCDSSTGDCECFSGYRGLACQEQEALT